jgi:hypothetical protein
MSVSVSVRMSVDNNFGQVKQVFSVPSQSSVQQIQRMDGAIINVSTNVQTLTLSNVSGEAGYAYLRNVSVPQIDNVTNNSYIVVGAMSGTNLSEFAEFRPGEPGVVPLARTVTLGVKLDTSLNGTNAIFLDLARLHYAINSR